MMIKNKFEDFLKEQDNFNPANYNVGGGYTPQQPPQSIYTPKSETPSFLGNLLGKAIEFKLMGNILKNSINSNMGSAVAGAAASSTAGAVVRTGIFARMATTLGSTFMPLMANPYFWAGVGVVAVGTWGYYYLSGNENMFEIEEIWADGKHSDNNDKTKEVYKVTASTLHHASYLGTIITKKIFDSENLYMRVDVKNQSIASKFDAGVYGVNKNINNVKKIYNDSTLDYWINKVSNSYRGYNVSGKNNPKDYTLLKSYVSKYDLESSSNLYKVELAEESEGWYDTLFDNFIPGMSLLGYSSFMLSSEYLNNINSLSPLSDKTFLYKIVDCYWKNKVKGLDSSSMNSTTFSNFIVWATGKSYFSESDLDNVQVCLRGNENDINAEPEVRYSFSELMGTIGKKIKEEIVKYTAGESKLAHTNVTVAFAMFSACFTVMDILTNSFATQVAMYEAFKKKQQEIKIKQEEEKKETDPEYRAKYSEEVIDKLMSKVDFSKYEG